MSSKMTIIEGNSNDKDNVRAYMVKGEPGKDGVSPTITPSRSGEQTTLTIVDAEGTKQAVLNDGFSPTVETSKEDGVTTVEITDINGTRTTEIVDGIDLTGGVPTDGVIGFDGEAADIPDGYEVIDNLFDNYSTDEQVIGKWIDGKKIYRRVITISSINTNANTTDVPITLSNLNEIINISGSVRTNSGQYKPIVSQYLDSSGVVPRYCFSVYTIYTTTLTVSYGDWWKTVFGKANVIIEYTKTTD